MSGKKRKKSGKLQPTKLEHCFYTFSQRKQIRKRRKRQEKNTLTIGNRRLKNT